MEMQAVILAGGKGTRLRPFTASLPKPLVPVGDYPILEIILRQLKRSGFKDVVISTGHLAGLIEAYCGDGRRWGLKVRYVREDKPLSTAGALKLVRGLKSDFLAVNGDVLTTLDFGELVSRHRRMKAAATLALCRRTTVVDFGVIGLGGGGLVERYTEKPSFRYLVSMGVNVFSPRALAYIEKDEFLGIPELIHRLRSAGERVAGFKSAGEWLDIGRPEDYQQAQEIFSSPRARARYLR